MLDGQSKIISKACNPVLTVIPKAKRTEDCNP